jgi:hypothetical protein
LGLENRKKSKTLVLGETTNVSERYRTGFFLEKDILWFGNEGKLTAVIE